VMIMPQKHHAEMKAIGKSHGTILIATAHAPFFFSVSSLVFSRK
jgi:hypothetical protein